MLYVAANGENSSFGPIKVFGVEVKKPILRGNLKMWITALAMPKWAGGLILLESQFFPL